MIKEIEVGGVKHSIALADDMVGTGLIKAENGSVYLNLDEEGKSYTGSYITGLAFSGDKLCLIRHILAYGLAGTGVYVGSGRLCVSGADSTIAPGSGLWNSGEGLAVSGADLAGSGLFEYLGPKPLRVKINSGSGLKFEYTGDGGNDGISINIAKRSSGLRLFFNSNGELDVTQD